VEAVGQIATRSFGELFDLKPVAVDASAIAPALA
jgi:hypothetical protein